MAFGGPGEAQPIVLTRATQAGTPTNRHVISMPDKWNIPGMPLGILLFIWLRL
jgi:hypothetical protein